MRARSRWKTRIPDDHLPVILDVLGWMPHPNQSSSEVTTHMERILATIPQPKQGDLRRGHVLTVFRARTNTWGIVSREQPDVLTFRIESDDSADVRKATEDLCESLVLDYRRHWRVRDHAFQPVGTLEILEKDGEKVIHDGNFVRGRLRRAFRERGPEAFTGVLFLLLAAICLWGSQPTHFIDSTTFEGQRMRWMLDFWGRLGTAFAATGLTGALYITFSLLSVNRQRYVVWNQPKSR